MDEINSNSIKGSHQSPDQKHHIQSLWQIWAPLGMVVLLAAGFFCATVIVTQNGSMDIGQAQNAAVILIIIPLAIIGILSFVALGLAIYGTSRIFSLVPKLQSISHQIDSISYTITNWSNRLMLPFVLFKKLRDRLPSKKHKQLPD